MIGNKHPQDYRAANGSPEVPNEFEDVDTFLDYNHRRQSYETHLRQHENILKKAKKEYADAADQLMLFLPDGVPLRSTYQGEQSELFGTEYVIVRKQGESNGDNQTRRDNGRGSIQAGLFNFRGANIRNRPPRMATEPTRVPFTGH